ncbi:MAG TPA: acylphosphatase, partial [Solirubrobacteraceae bacterium]|nr:acylphosphatase [Solirubrobacteraceae bacterium]
MTAAIQRVRVRVEGVVQGVGFRPFVHRLAGELGVAGFVRNDERGALIEAEGAPQAIEALLGRLVAEAPPLAEVQLAGTEVVPARAERAFAIVASTSAGSPDASITPDAATCEACLRELFDPGDRRYRYPFINCTDCGPRFTIVRGVPYDRPLTTMAGFPMCADCRHEYEDPLDRRFHAEPIACPVCGPQLSMPLEEAVAVLSGGGVLAVKGLGGYHLACDAADESAVARLRARKLREDKPFAVMTTEPGELAELDADELAL